MIYTAVTYPVGGPSQIPEAATNRRSQTIGYDENQFDFVLQSVSVSASTITPVTQAKLVCTTRDVTLQIPSIKMPMYSLLREGDAIRIFESDPTLPEISPTAIFTGVIQTVDFNYTEETGIEITLSLGNLLWQWTKQATINTFDLVSQGLTDYFSNQVALGKTLALLVTGSVVELLTSEGVLGNSQNVTYQGTDLPVKLGMLSLDDTLWTYIPVNMKKLDTLLTILKPYQQLLYQLPDGTIVIDAPRLTAADSNIYTFAPDMPQQYKRMKSLYVRHNATGVTNRMISSLINFGFFPPTKGIDDNYIMEIDNSFGRAAELLNSGVFEMTNVQSDSISNAMITDPTLLAYLDGPIPAAGYEVKTLQGTTTIAGTYASRALAVENIGHTGVQIRMARQGTMDVDLPLGQMVTVNYPSLLDAEELQLYCHSIQIDHHTGGTDMTLQLCRKYAITALWESGQ